MQRSVKCIVESLFQESYFLCCEIGRERERELRTRQDVENKSPEERASVHFPAIPFSSDLFLGSCARPFGSIRSKPRSLMRGSSLASVLKTDALIRFTWIDVGRCFSSWLPLSTIPQIGIVILCSSLRRGNSAAYKWYYYRSCKSSVRVLDLMLRMTPLPNSAGFSRIIVMTCLVLWASLETSLLKRSQWFSFTA